MLSPNALGLLLRLLVMNIGQGVVRAQNAIKVTVGANDTLLFKPRSMHAEAGDFILFDFYDGFNPLVVVCVFNQKNHSLVQSTFESPCHPHPSPFYSGFVPSIEPHQQSPNSFILTINNTDPIWFYCSQGRHCQTGMVGVINQHAQEQTIETFVNVALIQNDNITPDGPPRGGILVPVAGSSSLQEPLLPDSNSSAVNSNTVVSVTESSVTTSASIISSSSTSYPTNNSSPLTSSFFIDDETFPATSIPTPASSSSLQYNNASATIEPISIFDLSRPPSDYIAPTSVIKTTSSVPTLSQGTKKMDLRVMSIWGAFVLAATWHWVAVGI